MKKEIVILKRILPILLENPSIMFGFDTSREDIDYVLERGRIPIRMLQNLGGDNFFLANSKKLKLKIREAKAIDFYLQYKLRNDELELKALFPFLE